MNVQVTDFSSGNHLHVIERYAEGTITTTGYINDGFFNTTVVTELHNGYRSEERLSGQLYPDGTQVNVQRYLVSEQLPYAPHHRSMGDYDSSYNTYQPYASDWRAATR